MHHHHKLTTFHHHAPSPQDTHAGSAHAQSNLTHSLAVFPTSFVPLSLAFLRRIDPVSPIFFKA
jgi:hypothetical protein